MAIDVSLGRATNVPRLCSTISHRSSASCFFGPPDHVPAHAVLPCHAQFGSGSSTASAPERMSPVGSLTGTPAQNEENLAFAEREGIHALIEEEPLETAAGAFDRMLAGKAQFRMVLRP